MTHLRSALTALPLALTMIASTARAQTPAAPEAPPAPPAGYAPPPANYAPPPAGYALPPGYAYPPVYIPLARAPAGPATLPYKDGYPIPDGYHPEKELRTGLIIGGAITFGLMYLLPAVPAAMTRDKSLVVPIAGPFIQLGHLDFTPGIEDRGFTSGAAVLLVIDGVAQAAGAAMLLAGLTTKRDVLVRNDVAGVTVRVAPLTMGHGGTGIGLVGTM